MADDKDNKLLNEIKNYLEITWDDSLGDEKIRGMVKRGMAAISGKIGECNFYCLLYTSPSPRDGLLSRMPSSA